MFNYLIDQSATTDELCHPDSVWAFSVPSIVAVPWRGVHRLCGELVGPQGGGAAGRGPSQRVGAVQRGGRGAVASGGALLRLVLQDDTNGEPKVKDQPHL